MSSQTAAGRYQEIRRVTLVGSAVDLALGVVKIVAGIYGSSQALVADGIHSLSDLATDFMVLVAAKHGSREADEEHPYGHGRFETIATVALGIALVVVALGIAFDAIRRLFLPELLLHPGWLALAVATVSIGAKEWTYHYTMHTARKLNSNLLRANAWHSRSDAISSVIVVIGVAGSMAGLTYLDAIAAVGVAYMITKIGVGLAWHSIRELVDTGLESEEIEAIQHAIMSVNGVQATHLLRTRRMGGHALVDVHIIVDPDISVSEGHQISETVRSRLIRDINVVEDVMVHIDPEDDENAAPCSHLPLRDVIMQRLENYWRDVGAARAIESITLHYLDGKIRVEPLLDVSRLGDSDDARKAGADLAAAVASDPDIKEVRPRFIYAQK
jgi:cation diffusion facilitator family transporter